MARGNRSWEGRNREVVEKRQEQEEIERNSEENRSHGTVTTWSAVYVKFMYCLLLIYYKLHI